MSLPCVKNWHDNNLCYLDGTTNLCGKWNDEGCILDSQIFESAVFSVSQPTTTNSLDPQLARLWAETTFFIVFHGTGICLILLAVGVRWSFRKF